MKEYLGPTGIPGRDGGDGRDRKRRVESANDIDASQGVRGRVGSPDDGTETLANIAGAPAVPTGRHQNDRDAISPRGCCRDPIPNRIVEKGSSDSCGPR